MAESAASHGLIIRLIIQTIRRDPSGAVWTDKAPNVSRPDPCGADQIDAEYQPTDLLVRVGLVAVRRLLVDVVAMTVHHRCSLTRRGADGRGMASDQR